MFGLLASGRLVNTDVQEGGVNNYYFTLEHVEGVNHIVVFLTGQVPFSEGYGGGVYFGWPGEDGGIMWQLLGFISNTKPSAIFKISNVKPGYSTLNPFGDAMMASIGQISSTTVLVGISVDPLDQLAQQTPAVNTTASNVDSFTEFTYKMLENFSNFAASFAVCPAQTPDTFNISSTYVPIGVLQQWQENFLRRLQANPNFWRTM